MYNGVFFVLIYQINLGKGTQCARLAVEFNYIHLSAGDLLRAEVSTGSELGKTLDKMMKEGAIVPLVSVEAVKEGERDEE